MFMFWKKNIEYFHKWSWHAISKARNSTLWKMLFVTSALLWISVLTMWKALDILKFAENLYSNESKFIFQVKKGHLSFQTIIEKNPLNLVYEIKKCRSLMESLIAGFVQFSSTTVKFLFVKEKLYTRLCLYSILRFSKRFLISQILSRLATCSFSFWWLFLVSWVLFFKKSKKCFT